MTCERKNCKVFDGDGNIRISTPEDMKHYLKYHRDDP